MEAENMQVGEKIKEVKFSRAIKAGKRLYYVDVKENRNGEYYLALTESKKIVTGDEESPQVNFEKHKIFIYREDFDKILAGLHEAVAFIEEKQGKAEPRAERMSGLDLDIEF